MLSFPSKRVTSGRSLAVDASRGRPPGHDRQLECSVGKLTGIVSKLVRMNTDLGRSPFASNAGAGSLIWRNCHSCAAKIRAGDLKVPSVGFEDILDDGEAQPRFPNPVRPVVRLVRARVQSVLRECLHRRPQRPRLIASATASISCAILLSPRSRRQAASAISAASGVLKP